MLRRATTRLVLRHHLCDALLATIRIPSRAQKRGRRGDDTADDNSSDSTALKRARATRIYVIDNVNRV